MWIILIIIELLYISFSTFFSLKYCNDLLKGELLRTFVRSISLIIYLYIYNRKKIHQTNKINNSKDKIVIFLSVILIMLFPLLFQKAGFTGPLQLIWILSSFIVGFREELFYRGLLQNRLSTKYSIVTTLIITSMIFTSYHVIYFIWGQWITLIQVFIWSLFIGIIYIKTKKIILVSLIHSIYDAIPFVTPFKISSIPYFYGLLFVGISTIILFPLVIIKNKNLTTAST